MVQRIPLGKRKETTTSPRGSPRGVRATPLAVVISWFPTLSAQGSAASSHATTGYFLSSSASEAFGDVSLLAPSAHGASHKRLSSSTEQPSSS